MAKSNAPATYKVTLFSRGHVTLKGTILSLSPGRMIIFHYKKPRSSRYAQKTIAWEDLICYEGQQGKAGSVTFLSPKSQIRQVKGTIDLDEKLNLATITTEDGEVINSKPIYMDAVADEDIEALSDGTKKKKRVEAEEEEAPKKKKKAA